MACGGCFLQKKSQILEEKNINLILLHSISLRYYCSINLKMQSEHSRFRPDTNSLASIIKSVSIQTSEL